MIRRNNSATSREKSATAIATEKNYNKIVIAMPLRYPMGIIYFFYRRKKRVD